MIGPFVVRKRLFLPPWGRFDGITIAPFIFLRPGWSESDLRHELIHIHQVREVGWLRFYVRYLWDSLVRRVPYPKLGPEAEAYRHEADPGFLPPELEQLVRRDG